MLPLFPKQQTSLSATGLALVGKLSSPKSIEGWPEWSRMNIKKGGRSSANQMSPTCVERSASPSSD
jgi:hypothetical protein